jgi:flagellar motility protein MotE (MotC chaperone)
LGINNKELQEKKNELAGTKKEIAVFKKTEEEMKTTCKKKQ